jgi:hypothetical protein
MISPAASLAASPASPDYLAALEGLRAGKDRAKPATVFQRLRINPTHCVVDSLNRIWVQGNLCIDGQDERLEILHACHSAPAAGHPGEAGALELLRREYYWPRTRKDVIRFVHNCKTCRTTKSVKRQQQGLLHPMPIPHKPMTEIGIDFVVDLPGSFSHEGDAYKNILTITDGFSKFVRYNPFKSMTAKATAHHFVKHVFAEHGLPEKITSDRGPQFVAAFWKELLKTLQIGNRLSSPYHPQTDGQSERTDQDMEQYMGCFVNYKQNDWVNWLPVAQFARNNHPSASTGVTPFIEFYGCHLRTIPFDTVEDTIP